VAPGRVQREPTRPILPLTLSEHREAVMRFHDTDQVNGPAPAAGSDLEHGRVADLATFMAREVDVGSGVRQARESALSRPEEQVITGRQRR